MYSLRESNLVKNKVESFLKSTGITYYNEKYIQSVDASLTEIDFILNVNDCNVCIMTKFITPAPSSSSISKFIMNLNQISQLTSQPVYGIILLKSDISSDSVFQLKTSGIEVQMLQNNDKEILHKMFIQFMYSNNVYEIDSEGDTIMYEY
jgi:hypothetical protein